MITLSLEELGVQGSSVGCLLYVEKNFQNVLPFDRLVLLEF